MANIKAIAEREGEGYHSTLTWHDEIEPFKNYEEAKDFIQRKDNGWYDDHAVRYYDYSEDTNTKKMVELKNKYKELIEGHQKYSLEHSVHNFKAKYIGCEKCGSKLSREHLAGERCPLCRTDLRSKSTLEKLQRYKDKIIYCMNKIQAEKEKQKKKAKIKWLVKIEYHS